MTLSPKLFLSVLALAALQACSTLSADNVALNSATRDFAAAQANPDVQRQAPIELGKAQAALGVASTAWHNRAADTEVNHLSYLAKQSVAVAVETTRRKNAEAEIANADKERTRLLLAARTEESMKAQRDAQISKGQAQDAAADAAAANQRTREAEQYAAQLQSRLTELNAKETARGYVITVGDVLFDTARSELKPGASSSVERLGTFLLQYPQRTVLVEGYTDNVGGTEFNQDLSARRADAVRNALVAQGVANTRIATRGYGEAYPVSSNASAEGRQANRRVEMVLSDDKGTITPR